MDEPLVSVFTCVYNRADKIHRVFSSMKAQTYKNIEHIVVNDGSTDNVLELLEAYRKEVPFTVLILNKPNGGKHTATNMAWDNCHGDFIVQLDSDDELLPDGIEKLVGLVSNVPKRKRDEYWCYVGRCMTQLSSDMVGLPYPDNINALSKEDAALVDKQVGGEKIALISSKALAGFRFPEPAGVKFVPEGVLWEPLNAKYRSWYSNEIIRKYYVDEGENLSHQRVSRQMIANKVWSCRWQLENMFKYHTKGMKCLIPYCIGYHLTGRVYKRGNPYMVEGNGFVNLLLALLFVPSYIFHFIPALWLKMKGF